MQFRGMLLQIGLVSRADVACQTEDSCASAEELQQARAEQSALQDVVSSLRYTCTAPSKPCPSQSAESLQTLCHACIMAQAVSADAFACILQQQLLVVILHTIMLIVKDVGVVCESCQLWSACHAAILCTAGVR